MPDIDDINDSITQNAADGLAEVTVGGQQVRTMSIEDQIAAANHVAAQAAAGSSKFGLRFTKLVPPGCG